jgi:hypothetical protein
MAIVRKLAQARTFWTEPMAKSKEALVIVMTLMFSLAMPNSCFMILIPCANMVVGTDKLTSKMLTILNVLDQLQNG